MLTDLVAGKYGGTTAGIIRFIGDNDAAVDAICNIEADGTHAVLVCGALEELCVGGVFVEWVTALYELSYPLILTTNAVGFSELNLKNPFDIPIDEFEKKLLQLDADERKLAFPPCRALIYISA